MDAVAIVSSALFSATAGAVVLYGYIANKGSDGSENFSYFQPKKKLGLKDSLLLEMLEHNETSGANQGKASFVVTDPNLPDNPIVYSSVGFCQLTQYKKSEIENRNCRFLQGEGTREDDIDVIRRAVKERKEANICLLNYKKDGTSFNNQFFLCPLFDENDQLAYFIGVQAAVPEIKSHQEGENVGWRISMWL